MKHSAMRFAAIVVTFGLLLVVSSQLGKAQRGTPAPAPARSSDADWPMHNRDLAGTRYSPLNQINTSNVATLVKAWSFKLQPDNGPALTGSEVFQEVTPIVVNGVMYMPAGNRIVALEPETGKEVWRHELKEGRASFRGVAYWPGDGAMGPRIIFTSAKKLIALNANNGTLAEGFGINGEQDIQIGFAGIPIIYKNMVFVGATIFGPGEQHIDSGTTTALHPALNPRAYDARTGAKVWEFHSVPLPGEFGNDTWQNGSWKDRTGTNIWSFTLTLDEQRGIVYLPIGGANYNYYGGDRPGNNLFANTLVAVDAATGIRKWHFQTVHHELWDFDLPPAPVLFDIVQNGRTIPALAQTGKLGYMFILNRETGEAIYPIVERPVPKGNVPGEWYSPTQPIPVKPAPIARVSMSAADLVTAEDTTPEHAAACKALWETNKYYNEGPYSPWQYKEGNNPPSIIFPGATGGPNWGATAIDKTTNYVFVATKDAPATGWIQKNPQYSEATKATQLPYTRANAPGLQAMGLPCYKPPWSSLVAVNANTGDIAWRVPLGINNAMPEGKKNAGSAGSGGPIATAGGLVFIAATGDSRFRAFDSKTGKELWAMLSENGMTATPMTYQGRNGKQYIAIVAAGGNAATQSLNVYSLP